VKTAAFRSSLVLLSIIAAFAVPRSLAQASASEANTAELTQVDLFGLPDWQHQRIAVDGFTLGITLERALEIAKARNLRIQSNARPALAGDVVGPCRQGSCSAYKIDGPYIGVGLFFEMDRLTRITVSFSQDMDLDVKKVNVTQEFKGLTYQFFTQYSSTLRNRILGPAEATSDLSRSKDTANFRYIKYECPASGVVLHVTLTKDPTPETLDVALDFLAPH